MKTSLIESTGQEGLARAHACLELFRSETHRGKCSHQLKIVYKDAQSRAARSHALDTTQMPFNCRMQLTNHPSNSINTVPSYTAGPLSESRRN